MRRALIVVIFLATASHASVVDEILARVLPALDRIDEQDAARAFRQRRIAHYRAELGKADPARLRDLNALLQAIPASYSPQARIEAWFMALPFATERESFFAVYDRMVKSYTGPPEGLLEFASATRDLYRGQRPTPADIVATMNAIPIPMLTPGMRLDRRYYDYEPTKQALARHKLDPFARMQFLLLHSDAARSISDAGELLTAFRREEEAAEALKDVEFECRYGKQCFNLLDAKRLEKLKSAAHATYAATLALPHTPEEVSAGKASMHALGKKAERGPLVLRALALPQTPAVFLALLPEVEATVQMLPAFYAAKPDAAERARLYEQLRAHRDPAVRRTVIEETFSADPMRLRSELVALATAHRASALAILGRHRAVIFPGVPDATILATLERATIDAEGATPSEKLHRYLALGDDRMAAEAIGELPLAGLAPEELATVLSRAPRGDDDLEAKRYEAFLEAYAEKRSAELLGAARRRFAATQTHGGFALHTLRRLFAARRIGAAAAVVGALALTEEPDALPFLREALAIRPTLDAKEALAAAVAIMGPSPAERAESRYWLRHYAAAPGDLNGLAEALAVIYPEGETEKARLAMLVRDLKKRDAPVHHLFLDHLERGEKDLDAVGILRACRPTLWQRLLGKR